MMVDSDSLFGERRRFPRKACLRTIGIGDDEQMFDGYLRDVGLAGAFIEPLWHKRAEVGQKLSLQIPYGLRDGHVSIQAMVKWTRSHGLGVQFINAHARREYR